MGVLEHIEKLDTLIALASSQGASVNERARVAYIINSLQKVRQKEFEKDLEEAERGNHTLPWLIQRLSRTATNMAMRRKKLGKRNQYDLYSPHEEEKEFVGTTQERAQIVYCLPTVGRLDTLQRLVGRIRTVPSAACSVISRSTVVPLRLTSPRKTRRTLRSLRYRNEQHTQ